MNPHDMRFGAYWAAYWHANRAAERGNTRQTDKGAFDLSPGASLQYAIADMFVSVARRIVGDIAP